MLTPEQRELTPEEKQKVIKNLIKRWQGDIDMDELLAYVGSIARFSFNPYGLFLSMASNIYPTESYWEQGFDYCESCELFYTSDDNHDCKTESGGFTEYEMIRRDRLMQYFSPTAVFISEGEAKTYDDYYKPIKVKGSLVKTLARYHEKESPNG